jgi:hypothetical protein
MTLQMAVRLLVCALWCAPAIAHAEVKRFALVAGNNHGLTSDITLRHAIADAERVSNVLSEIGGFAPENMLLLRDATADGFRQALTTMFDRIEAQSSRDSSLLFLYYSGHADAQDLHLRESLFSLSELGQLARSAPTGVRLVILDACQSGALTRVKGGRVQQAFALPEERELGAGEVFLTASASSEDAQESDELRGSFFTHAFVSGLLGAADDDHDGAVALEEAYRYAYQSTLRATSRTRSGSQHPTYHYDLRGAGHVILTWPERFARERAALQFPEGLSFLIMRDSAEGQVVAELSERSPARCLSLTAGEYFVRGRGNDVLYEGRVSAPAASVTPVQLDNLERVEYAKLVRKGRSERVVAHSFEAGVRGRTVLPGTAFPCAGGFIGYGVDFADLGARARLDFCAAGFDNVSLQANTYVYDLDLRLYHVWDLSKFFVEIGLGGGASLWTQRFETTNVAPPRSSLAPYMSLGAAVGMDFSEGYYASLDIAGETHFLRVRESESAPTELQVGFAARAALLLGRRF